MKETQFFQSNKTLLVAGLWVYNILVEVCFVLKSFQVLNYWSLALSLIEEGNTFPIFPATTVVLFVTS